MSQEEAFLEISRLMKVQRKKSGLSQTQIAHNYGGDMSQQSIGRYEIDPSKILSVLPKAKKIFEAYGFNTEEVNDLMNLLYYGQTNGNTILPKRTVNQAALELAQEFTSIKDLTQLSRLLLETVEKRL